MSGDVRLRSQCVTTKYVTIASYKVFGPVCTFFSTGYNCIFAGTEKEVINVPTGIIWTVAGLPLSTFFRSKLGFFIWSKKMSSVLLLSCKYCCSRGDPLIVSCMSCYPHLRPEVLQLGLRKTRSRRQALPTNRGAENSSKVSWLLVFA